MAVWYFSRSHSAKSPDFDFTKVRLLNGDHHWDTDALTSYTSRTADDTSKSC